MEALTATYRSRVSAWSYLVTFGNDVAFTITAAYNSGSICAGLARRVILQHTMHVEFDREGKPDL